MTFTELSAALRDVSALGLLFVLTVRVLPRLSGSLDHLLSMVRTLLERAEVPVPPPPPPAEGLSSMLKILLPVLVALVALLGLGTLTGCAAVGAANGTAQNALCTAATGVCMTVHVLCGSSCEGPTCSTPPPPPIPLPPPPPPCSDSTCSTPTPP